MNYCERFAPSPTGHLHLGSLLTALASWLCARHAGGRWLLRIEDIDPPRQVAGSAAGIIETLARLGMRADEAVLYQSSRGDAYRHALEQLRSRKLAFPCWCSRSALAAHGGVHRDGRCLSQPDRSRAPAWRLRVDEQTLRYSNALDLSQVQMLRQRVGDFVLLRADGFWSYQLACAVDDAAQGMTEVVRGRDLLDSTPRQILLLDLLGQAPPVYRHIGLALDPSGRKLGKSAADQALIDQDPLASLTTALGALGIPIDTAARTPQAILQAALAAFDPARLPQHDFIANGDHTARFSSR